MRLNPLKVPQLGNFMEPVNLLGVGTRKTGSTNRFGLLGEKQPDSNPAGCSPTNTRSKNCSFQEGRVLPLATSIPKADDGSWRLCSGALEEDRLNGGRNAFLCHLGYLPELSEHPAQKSSRPRRGGAREAPELQGPRGSP